MCKRGLDFGFDSQWSAAAALIGTHELSPSSFDLQIESGDEHPTRIRITHGPTGISRVYDTLTLDWLESFAADLSNRLFA
jgi:hypothetical protein